MDGVNPARASLGRPSAPTKDEWLTRYKQRLIDVAGITEAVAQDCADAETFEVLSDGFEDHPEWAADEEMSYWSD